MSHDELIASLRADMAATSSERDAAAAAGMKTAATLHMEQEHHMEAEAEIARLEAEAKARSTPDAQIRAGLLAIRTKFASLFG